MIPEKLKIKKTELPIFIIGTLMFAFIFMSILEHQYKEKAIALKKDNTFLQEKITTLKKNICIKQTDESPK